MTRVWMAAILYFPSPFTYQESNFTYILRVAILAILFRKKKHSKETVNSNVIFVKEFL